MLLILRLAALLLPLAVAATALDGHQPQKVGAWTVLMPQPAPTDAQEWARFTAALELQVKRVESAVPADRLVELHAFTIVVDAGEHRAFGCQFHPSADWLAANGYPKEMAKTVEICNWREFITLVQGQPWCLLHELAHGYHDRHPEISAALTAALQHAKDSGLYQAVTRNHGTKTMPAYALTNIQEYFAELSEAYFGDNDFQPYDRGELENYDAQGFKAVDQIWRGR